MAVKFVKDERQKPEQTRVNGMPVGTWFLLDGGLYLMSTCGHVVHVVSGRNLAYSEDTRGQPVDVEIRIVGNVQ